MSENAKQTIAITIDGVECTCEKGEFIYDVARRNNIPIPVLCRSDAFDDHRACCRICIVEVEIRGRRKVVTSCVYPIEQECAIFTKSEKILEERAVILALLGHRAPDAQRISDMNKAWGREGFERLVTLDNEKCILCGLCVQACDSLGTGAISTVLRGTEKKVSTPYDNPSEFCVGCLSCSNVCPTGAISYTQTETTRTIWNREFALLFCEECGSLMGTPEAAHHAVRAMGAANAGGAASTAGAGAAGSNVAGAASAAGTGAETPRICDACRKRHLANEMMQTYRYV